MAGKQRLFTVSNAATNVPIASRVHRADTSLRRAIGLLGKRSLSAEEGLWILPCSGVHTIGMSFPIDVIGLDRQHRVVRLWQNLKPQRLTSLSWSVHSVLELSPGVIQNAPILLGDPLEIHEVTFPSHAPFV